MGLRLEIGVLHKSQVEFEKPKKGLDYLRAWQLRLSADTSTNRSGITESSVSAMISRISGELADYAAEKKLQALMDDETTEDAEIDSVG